MATFDAHTIKVLVADDDAVVRETVVALVAEEPSLDLVAVAEDTPQAVELAAEVQPDVALLDLDMPGGGGWKAAEEIAAVCPKTQVLALTAIDTAEARVESALAGVVDFITKGSSNGEIVDAIRRSVQMPGSNQLFGGLPPRSAEPSEPLGPPAPPEPAPSSSKARIAELEHRVTSLEQTVVKLLGE